MLNKKRTGKEGKQMRQFFKKTLLVTAAIVLILGSSALATYPDGTFIGKAKGNNGPIKVEVTVTNGKIAKIKVLESEETPIISDTAFAEVSKEIIASQKFDVDTVMGATVSSRAMMSAVENALKDPGFKDGTYEVIAKGNNGPVKVKVVIKGGRITAIDVLESEETPIISDTAFTEVSKAILATQSTDVDAVLGATVSSRAMISAVDEVLKMAKAPEKVVLKDGTFEGTARGHNAPLKVKVTIKDGKIKEIIVLEHKETPGISDAAFKQVIPAMIEKQSVEVDAVAGASVTSKALMEAVKNALK
jgi:uncharacterized protein with FMN-binding domain